MENDLVNRKQLLDNILYEIEMVYINENLLDLNPNSIVKINEKNTLQFFTDITRKNRVVEVKIQDFYFFNDLAKKSSDIKFLLANMYLHKPFLWDFLSNWFDHNNKKNFYYYSSLHDSRYMTYCDLLFQSIYNYWDKIGDLLAFYFVPKLNGKEIYFSKVLKKIPTDYKKSHNFLWLLEFDKNDYSDLNSKRIQTVHYSNYSSSFKENWMANVSNEVGIEKLQNEISSLTDYFKIHLEKVIIGFEKALNLIDEVK